MINLKYDVDDGYSVSSGVMGDPPGDSPLEQAKYLYNKFKDQIDAPTVQLEKIDFVPDLYKNGRRKKHDKQGRTILGSWKVEELC